MWIKPSHTALGQPLPQRLPGVGGANLPSPCHFIGKHHTMVIVFVGWLTTLINRQSSLFIREKTYDKVDDKFFVGNTKFIKIKWNTYCKVEYLERPYLTSVSSRKIFHGCTSISAPSVDSCMRQ